MLRIMSPSPGGILDDLEGQAWNQWDPPLMLNDAPLAAPQSLTCEVVETRQGTGRCLQGHAGG